MNTKKRNIEILLWTALVLILSYLCYIPMFLEKKGIHISRVGFNARYLFVTIPFVVSILFSFKKSNLKRWFLDLFAVKVKCQAIFSCVILGSVGLFFSLIYCMIVGDKDLFTSNYPTALAVVISCSYLFVTALIEEIAWRGFLLNKIAISKGKKIALIYVGMIWSIWHIPMWAIRNSLGFREILIYFIWTILISFVLGMLYYKNKSIIMVSLAHMIFNTCYIAPVKYNVILLGCLLLLSIFVFNKKDKTLDVYRSFNFINDKLNMDSESKKEDL